MKRLIAPSLVIVVCGMAAARDEGPDTELTDQAVAALEARLGKSEVKVDEVRVTDDGVACIDFRENGSANGRAGHAVYQGEKLLVSTSANEEGFERAWSENCLGPRGGAPTGQ